MKNEEVRMKKEEVRMKNKSKTKIKSKPNQNQKPNHAKTKAKTRSLNQGSLQAGLAPVPKSQASPPRRQTQASLASAKAHLAATVVTTLPVRPVMLSRTTNHTP